MRVPRTLSVLLFVVMLLAIPSGPGTPAQQEPAGTSPTGESGAATPGEEELEEFIPTEKVSADSAISFPVDI